MFKKILIGVGVVVLVIVLTDCASASSMPSSPTTSSDEVKSTTEFEGSCTKATLMDQDVTGGCYGWAFKTVFQDGTTNFSFHIGQNMVMHFIGAADPTTAQGIETTLITKTNAYQDKKLVGELPAKGKCTVAGDISVEATVDCEAVLSDGRSMVAVLKSSQPASFHDSFPKDPNPEGIKVRFWDDLTAVCTKALLDGEDQTDKCKGVNHVGFGNDRVDFMLGVGGHLVAFSGDQERGTGTGHYILYVNRLYHDKDFLPAKGKCELDGDPDGKSTLVCDASAVTSDYEYTAHAEFAVSAVTHKQWK